MRRCAQVFVGLYSETTILQDHAEDSSGSSLRVAKRRGNPEVDYESIIITAFQRMDCRATLAMTAHFVNNKVTAIVSIIISLK